MDWLPTLLAAAGAAPDARYPPDGINLLPQIGDGAAIRARTLFWRYKGNAQRAVRDGDFKFLKMLDNTFLFNVADDPMERANLKDRRRDVYDRLVAKWLEWNDTMLPEVDDSNTSNLTGDRTPDRPGAKPNGARADNPTRDRGR
jgi:arylsulfatase A-like enzyme